MRKVVQFAMFAMVIAVAGIPLIATSGAAPAASTATIVVRKVVTGTGTGPSAVTLTCNTISSISPIVFNFDAQGNPTTSSPSASPITIVGGAWQLTGLSGDGGTCNASETTTGGATSTSWTCAYSSTPALGPTSQLVTPAGCAAATGSGVGPINVVYAGLAAVSTQSSTVTFTNTFVAPPTPPVVAPAVVVAPTFTG